MLENHAAYMGTKAGTDHVVRCVANDFGHLGIRANSISPGITRTPMSGDALNNPEILGAFEAGYPLGRIGTVDDVAEAALWLASDACFMLQPANLGSQVWQVLPDGFHLPEFGVEPRPLCRNSDPLLRDRGRLDTGARSRRRTEHVKLGLQFRAPGHQ